MSDGKTHIDSCMFPQLYALNCPTFDYNKCILTDKFSKQRDAESKEGCGRSDLLEAGWPCGLSMELSTLTRLKQATICAQLSQNCSFPSQIYRKTSIRTSRALRASQARESKWAFYMTLCLRNSVKCAGTCSWTTRMPLTTSHRETMSSWAENSAELFLI